MKRGRTSRKGRLLNPLNPRAMGATVLWEEWTVEAAGWEAVGLLTTASSRQPGSGTKWLTGKAAEECKSEKESEASAESCKRGKSLKKKKGKVEVNVRGTGVAQRERSCPVNTRSWAPSPDQEKKLHIYVIWRIKKKHFRKIQSTAHCLGYKPLITVSSTDLQNGGPGWSVFPPELLGAFVENTPVSQPQVLRCFRASVKGFQCKAGLQSGEQARGLCGPHLYHCPNAHPSSPQNESILFYISQYS